MVPFKEWAVPKTPPHQPGAGVAPQSFPGHLPRFPCGSSPSLPEVTPQTSLGHLPRCPHAGWQLPCVTGPIRDPVFVPRPLLDVHINLWERLSPYTPAWSLFSLQKWDSLLAWQFIFYCWCVIPFWRIRLRLHCQSWNTEVATPQFHHHFPLEQAAAGWNGRCLCDLQ